MNTIEPRLCQRNCAQLVRPICWIKGQTKVGRDATAEVRRRQDGPAKAGPYVPSAFQSHAAPRTPLESPCAARTIRVRIPSEKMYGAQMRGTLV